MAKNWKEVRKEAVGRGAIDEAKVEELKRDALHRIQTYCLTQTRRQHRT